MKNKTLSLLLSLAFIACTSTIFAQKYRGEGPVIKKEVSIDDFDAVSSSGSMQVVIEYGATQKVIAEGHENIIDRLKTDVSGGKWRIGLKKGNYRDYKLKLFITMPTLTSIGVSGSSGFNISGFEKLDDLSTHISGSGSVNFNDKCEADDFDVHISGSGSFRGYDLHCQTADVHISGSGSVKVSVEEEISGSISGSGSVRYKGRPLHINVKTSGSGTVKSDN